MRSARFSYILCFTLVMLFGAFGSTPALADISIFETASERNAFQEASDGHYIKARQEAEKLLKENPNSVGANYTLALVFWQGEGNLLRAMQLLKTSIALFEKPYEQTQGVPNSSELQAWHHRMLKDLAQIYAELDNREEEIRIHELVADRYKARLSEDAVWALIKLGRFEEAQAISEHTIKGQDSIYVSVAYNNLTALEDARHRHLEAFKASQRAYAFSAGKSCVIMSNHARAHAILLRLDTAAELFLKSKNATQTDCPSNPLKDLAGLYLLDGSWQRAISAMQEVQTTYVEKRHLVQVEMVNRTMLASLLHVMGLGEKAWPMMKSVIESPARLGYDSLNKDQVDLANYAIYYAITSDAIQRQKERLEAYYRTEPFWFFKSKTRKLVLELQEKCREMERDLWSIHQKAFKTALKPENLKSFLMPYYVIHPIFNYVLSDMLGRRTAEFIIEFQENSLIPEEKEAVLSIFDHLSAYIAWKDGDFEKALNHIDAFQRHQKPRMKLMLYQLRLIQADIAMQQGETEKAFEMMTEVFQNFPALFRHFDIPLPVTFDNALTEATSEPLKDAYQALKHSPRLKPMDNAPFVITAHIGEQMMQICMNSQFGVQYACSSISNKDYEGVEDDTPMPAEIVNHFLHMAFSPKVDLSQKDLNSLDGSPIQVTADQALEDLLGVKKRPNKTDEE